MIVRRRIVLALLLLLVAAYGFAATPSRAMAQSPASAVLNEVNAFRASYGLPPLTVNAALTAAAQSHANWMASTGLYSHTGAGGSTPQSRANAAGYVGYVAENIVGGTGLTPQQGVTWWINSPSHFNTLISNQHTEVGIGFAQNFVDGFDQNFYVMVAGHQMAEAAAALAPGTTAAREQDELFVVAPLTLSAPGADGSIVHTVGDGQSLWAIAARYEVPLSDIMLFNNLTEDSVINPGDVLTIRWPEGVAAPPTPTPPTTYTVRSGDSAWTIAARFRISLDDFLWFNSMAEDDLLEPGDVVTIRLAEGQPLPPTPTPQLTHIVSSGETLWDISILYGLTVDDLLSLNGFTGNTVLSIGQEVYIRATPLPTPTPTSPPATFTPIAPGDSAGAAAVPLSASLAAATPTPPSPLADARRASASGNQPAPPSGVSNQIESGWMADWTLGVAIALITLAFLLLFVVMILLVRRLTDQGK